MGNHLSIKLKNEMEELHRVVQLTEDFCQEHGFAPDDIRNLHLCIEEALSNIISYAYDDDSEHLIQVDLQVDGQRISVTFTDDGKPFDPLKHAMPDINKPLEEKKIGGLGVHLFFKLMDRVEYQRDENKNILTIRKQTPLPLKNSPTKKEP